jgi:hypothetical protein
MEKIDFNNIDDATARLERIVDMGADESFSMFLSVEEQQRIQDIRIRRATKTGEKVKEVRDDEYVIHGATMDADGNLLDDFDISRFMREAEDDETGLLHDLKVDTRDLPRANNFFDFCKRLMGPNTKHPYPLQAWVGAMLFGEVCPVCSNKEWLDIDNVPKDYPFLEMEDHLVMLERGTCPKCKRGKWELIQNHGLNNYTQLVNCLGQRSGKSLSAAMYSAYHLHRFLSFTPLANLTNSMQASTELTFTFVSLTYDKAKGVLWTPFVEIINDSKYFNEYFACMDHYGNQYGKKLYNRASEFLRFNYRNIRFYPSGPKGSTLRGDTRIGGALDELGLFRLPKDGQEEDATSEIANADEAHKSLMRSLTTVSAAALDAMKKGHNFAPGPLLLNVSSPMSIRDKMMRLLKESRTEEGRTRILGVQKATWEFNPYLERDNPLIAGEFASNWEKAERDFGANPPLVHSRYMGVNSVREGIFVNGPNGHDFTYAREHFGELYGTINKRRTFPYPSVVAIDAGVSDNSFCVVSAHYNFDTGKTVISNVIECMPHDGRRINFNLMYEKVILPLCKATNAVYLTADQWQSLDILHRIRVDMGKLPDGKEACTSRQYSPRRADFDMLRALIVNKNVLCPTIPADRIEWIVNGGVENYKAEMNEKPVEHLLLQMLTVREVAEGKPPTKGENFTDDIYRAVVLAASAIHDPRIMERLTEALKYAKRANNGGSVLPVSLGRSQGFGNMRRF